MTGPRVTADDLAGLRRAAEAATPGPWFEKEGELIWAGVNAEAVANVADWGHPAAQADDAEFIAAANPATVLALLDEIDRLQRERLAAEVRACDMQAAAEEAHAEVAAAQTQLAKVRAAVHLDDDQPIPCPNGVTDQWEEGWDYGIDEMWRRIRAALAEGPAPETTP